LRNIYYGGLPASILLLHSDMSNGKCYDRAPLLAYALDCDYEVVYANINNIKLNPLYVDDCKKIQHVLNMYLLKQKMKII